MEKKQTGLQRMFEVLKAIEHEDLNNTQYSTLNVAEGECANTADYFGSKENITLQDNCMYICIWTSEYDAFDEYDFPQPDFTLLVITPGCAQGIYTTQVVLCYKFENK